MILSRPFVYAGMLSLLFSSAYSFTNNNSGCCAKMGGVSYCDSSAGRLVCNNGFYSTCYCTPHAVMDLHMFRGCCMWRGGVVPPSVNALGITVCNDGSVSEECSLNQGPEKVAAW